MQRDVEIEIDTVDKSGGFIGTLWLNKNENAAVALVQEGLATVHSYSADMLSWSKQLYAAEVCFVSHSDETYCLGNWIIVDPTSFSGRGKGEEAQRKYCSPLFIKMDILEDTNNR